MRTFANCAVKTVDAVENGRNIGQMRMLSLDLALLTLEAAKIGLDERDANGGENSEHG